MSQSEFSAATNSYASGGFQTNLELFDGLGRFVTASIPSGTPDPATGLIGDSSISSVNLSAGNYTLVLTDFLLNQSITATNLSDGFTSNFGDGVTFIDADGNVRTGDYAVSLVATAVPEPGTIWMAVIGIGCVATCAARKRRLAWKASL
jgi:hypothetical protein